MRRLLPLALLLATSLQAAIEPPREKEKWIATAVDDFAIASNASERETVDVATNLLRMREAIGKITKLKVRSGVPTSVILFRNARSFTPYRDAVMQLANVNISGLYLSREDANFILLQDDSAAGVDRVVFHELTHSFMRNTAPGLPLWFNEGVAEYYSTFETRGAKVEIGRPIEEHVHWLRNTKLMPLAELFAVDSGSQIYDERSRQGVFYAQSWALVHYLLVGSGERRESVPKFLSLLMANRPAGEAVRTAFGMELSKLESELRAYVQQRAFNFRSYALDELQTAAVPAPQPIPRDEVLYRLGDLLARSGPHVMADAESHLLDAVKLNPSHAGAHADLGMLYQQSGRDAQATKEFDEAVRLGTKDATAYITYGMSLLERRNGTRARPLFEKAVALAPTSARAWAGLGGSYVFDGQDLNSGITALEKSLALAPSQEDVAFNLVQLYARTGRGADAQRLIDTVLARSNNLELLRMARESVILMDVQRADDLLRNDKVDEALAILKPILAKTTDETLKKEIQHLITASEQNRVVRQHADAVNAAVTLANSGKRAEAAAALDKLIPEITNEELLKWAQELRAQLPKKKK